MMEQDYRDAPTVTPLWDKVHTARKPRECQCCKETIQPGERYASTGMLVDGVFEHWVRHQWGEQYPSGCPKQRERDKAELEAQASKDQALWNTGVR